MGEDENLDRPFLVHRMAWKDDETRDKRERERAGMGEGEKGSAILAEDYVELSPGQGRAPVTLNFSLDFLISR